MSSPIFLMLLCKRISVPILFPSPILSFKFQTLFKNLSMPAIDSSRKSPPCSNGPRNIRYILKTSAPNFLIYSSGLTTLPLDFDIFAPSLIKSPCARNFLNGSSKSTKPQSRKTLVRNLVYKRCKTACSAPPVYISIGSHFLIVFLLNGSFLFFTSGYLKKYQAESRKVSETSVSLSASPPHLGHFVFTNPSTVARGDLSVPVGRKSFTSGSKTGKSFSDAGCQSHFWQKIIGIGGPQWRGREISQSRRWYLTSIFPPTKSVIFFPASTFKRPLNGPEL